MVPKKFKKMKEFLNRIWEKAHKSQMKYYVPDLVDPT